MGFTEKLKKTISNISPETLDKAGLKLLAVPAAYTTYKGIKEKDPVEAGMGAAELGGLGVLHHAVTRAMKAGKH